MVRIQGNSAGNGGGIANGGNLSIDRTTLASKFVAFRRPLKTQAMDWPEDMAVAVAVVEEEAAMGVV